MSCAPKAEDRSERRAKRRGRREREPAAPQERSVGPHVKHRKCHLLRKPCECAGNVFDGDMLLETQTDVENFRQQQYAIVTGNLRIFSVLDQSDSIRNLKGLATLCNVQGNLEIVGNLDLLTLDGLESVQSVGGNLLIDSNTDLRSIDRLCSLRTIGGTFTVQGNSAVLEIAGLNCLESVGRFLSITNNENLCSITGFNSPAGLRIYSDFFIGTNPSLKTVDGFNSLLGVYEDFVIIENESLVCIAGFRRLRQIVDQLLVANNAALVSIDAFGQLRVVSEIEIANNDSLCKVSAFHVLRQAEQIEIVNCPLLDTLSAFSTLEAVEDLVIEATNLQSLDAFVALEFVDDDLVVENNPNLTNVDGLINLRWVDFDISVRNNSSLTSLSGFSGLQLSRQVQGKVIVENNAALADYCGLQSLAAADPTGSPTFQISGNAVDATKEDIAQLEPCDAREFFQRTLNRWLEHKQVERVVACSLAQSLTKATVCKWRAAKKLSFPQSDLLLGALQHCLFANEKSLPPCGPPLALIVDCCSLSARERFMLCNTKRRAQKSTCKQH